MRREAIVSKEVVLLNQTVNATATVTSDPIRMGYGENFSILVLIHSGAMKSVNVYYDITDSVQNDPSLVCTGVDSASQWVCPDTNGTIKSGAAITFADGFSPAVSKWGRFRVTGTGTNGADTVVSIVLLYWS
jgi:hypothetical protein